MVWLMDFRSHSKSEQFATLSHFDHSKSRLVQILNPHGIQVVNVCLIIKWSVYQMTFEYPTRKVWYTDDHLNIEPVFNSVPS